MKVGDVIEWRGVDKVHRGRIVMSDSELGENGFVCQLDKGKVFPLKDLRYAKSAKLIEV